MFRVNSIIVLWHYLSPQLAIVLQKQRVEPKVDETGIPGWDSGLRYRAAIPGRDAASCRAIRFGNVR
ncbi:MAG TPA: hypothetical protein VF798_06270, partial [Burkholderiaceae bacterium]